LVNSEETTKGDTMNIFGIGPMIAATGVTSFVAVILFRVARGQEFRSSGDSILNDR